MSAACSYSIVELRDRIKAGELSPVDLVEDVFERIRRLDPSLNCFSIVLEAEAMRDARELKAKIEEGKADELPLAGVPISVKDLIGVKGAPLTCGSKLKAAETCKFDSPLVERLRNAGAIIVGKTTTSEFGGKAVGDSPLTGITRNPWNPGKTSGGSSAGAAASVAAGITPCAIGTDGGGSVRIPAAMNGVVGFKPQFGRIPIYPESFAPSLAHAGVLGRSVKDVALVTSVIAGYDSRDSRSLHEFVPAYLNGSRREGKLKVAWSLTLGNARPEPEVRRLFLDALPVFEKAGCELEEWDASFWPDSADVWNRIFYGGLKRYLDKEAQAWNRSIDSSIASMISLFGDGPEEEEDDIRRAIVRRMDEVFSNYDLLLTPTLPVPAFEVMRNAPAGVSEDYPVTWSRYTYPFNISGHPAISLPAGMTKDRLPIGIQLISNYGEELDLMQLAYLYEAQSNWSFPF